MSFSFAAPTPDASIISVLTPEMWPAVAADLGSHRQRMAERLGFQPKPGRYCVIPEEGDAPNRVLFVTELATARGHDPFAAGRLVGLLPPGTYRFDPQTPSAGQAALAWALSSYRFTRYKAASGELPRLCAPEGVDARKIESLAASVALGRDLINTPASDLGPDALDAAAAALAVRFGASYRVVTGRDLEEGFPMVHAVGHAAHQPPRLADLTWGAEDAPRITLVGKGVTFDTGGLNIKPDAGMLLMKKDMGGAATALALAALIMEAGLRLRLRVLLPIVENAISAPSFRPGDVLRSRKGLTVEIGNTDAEGRLILADALALAGEEKPALIVDFATLTGAARVALGPDLPPFFTEDDALADALTAHGRAVNDPVWRLPLWHPYDATLDGKVADLSNVGASPFAGSIIAALFLRRFVEPDQPWVHIDMFGWVPTAKPGRPEGGEVQTARLLFDFLSTRYPA